MLSYIGKILELNLTKEKISIRTTDKKIQRKFIGGIGLAAKILFDETEANTKPLSEENLLVFMTGPLTATPMLFSGRLIVAGISPLTNIWGEAHMGGDFGDELKHAGFDGIIVKGKSSKPVYLWIHDEEAKICDATPLWGIDTYETTDRIKEKTHEKASVVTIGPAGEKMVRFATIMGEGRRARSAGRCGLGALMGFKKLKAVAVRGTGEVDIYDEEMLKANVSKIIKLGPYKSAEEKEKKFKKKLGHASSLNRRGYEVGGVPIKNWSQGTLERVEKWFKYEETYKSKPDFCRHCPYSCVTSRLSREGDRWGAHVEVFGPLGFNCLIVDGETIQKAYSLCNRYGLDTISTGGVIGFVMELMEKRLITKEDTDGVDLTWGNREAMIQMIRKIGEREGFGNLLGEGVKRVAKHIGGIAQEYALHVKGLEFPAHDPRATFGRALNYVTSNIGAGHYEGGSIASLLEDYYVDVLGSFASPDLGYPKGQISRFETRGKGELVAKAQNYQCMIDSLVICAFANDHHHVQPSHLVKSLSYATGWEMDLDEFMKTGERIFNLKRVFNVRRGISRKDDALPPRFITQPRGGGAGDNLPHIGLMLNEYYKYRGWSEEGIPTKHKLKELNLEECLVYGAPA